jgi:hypothetical protein
MAFESLRSLVMPPAVHAKPDVARVNSEGQNKREGRDQQKHKDPEELPASPIPNAQGQVIGKLIDTTV